MSIPDSDDLLAVPDEEDDVLWPWVVEKYREMFSVGIRTPGVWKAHDATKVLFYPDRVDHAFRESRDYRRCSSKKEYISLERLERMHWILPLIRGEIEGSSCHLVEAKSGRREPPNRLYVIWERRYCVWLEPLRSNQNLKFSSAYTAGMTQLRNYTRGGQGIWDWRRGKEPSGLASKKGAP